MKIQEEGTILRVSEVKELGAATAPEFRAQIRSALRPMHRAVRFDLSETTFVDSCGLGALVSLHKEMGQRKGSLTLIQPTPPVQQILELTRLQRIFSIEQRSEAPQ